MNEEVGVPLWAALMAVGTMLGLAVVVLAVLVSARKHRADVTARLDALTGTRHDTGDAPGADTLAPTGPRPPVPASDFVITHLGDQPEAPAARPAPVDPRFADTLLRESVVRSAAFLHGVRRALAPEVRHRIRFEVRQGTKQARRRRRAEMKTAHREWQARRRETGLDEGSAA